MLGAANGKVGKILEFPVRVPLLDDRLDGRLTDAAERAESEAQPVAFDRKDRFRFIDMGRQNVDVLLLHIGDILGNFLYFVDTIV